VPDGVPRRVPIPDPDGRTVGFITTAGHDSATEGRDLAGLFPAPSGEVAEVAMLHTQVTGSRDQAAHAPYAPSVLEDLEAAGFDYWALGHVHLRQGLSTNIPVHYAGNPQGQTPREDGAKGCLLVDLSDRAQPTIEFRELGPIRWVRLTVDDLQACHNLDEVVERVVQAWTATAAAEPDTYIPEASIMHLILTGACPIWRTLTLEDERRGLAEAVTARLGLIWTDIFPPNVRPVLDLAEHLERPDVLGEALRLVGAVRSGAQQLPELGEHELALPHLVEVRDTEAYLASLLDEDAAEDILARMLRTEATNKDARR